MSAWNFVNVVHVQDVAIVEEEKQASWIEIRWGYPGQRFPITLKEKGAICYVVAKEEPETGYSFYIERHGVAYQYDITELDETILSEIVENDLPSRDPQEYLEFQEEV